ncbi:hypothetical protein LZQ00_11180 [Sphingobacterium sp. SRCM116780]|uniref:hypothetical protein n=1 Tax=Sphingobacterium sp. SRCM116780 TaxID=2907623 RepID=UPI001F227DDD|nr:hypothetical protein [Sphingobacterium sp. SRCM116780]UIR54840.1 hypothetical protein LZQ00_11180 [Sphingobacterium sp. SRCM116780]
MKKKTQLYVPPKIEMNILQMEDGIATGSASLRPGDVTNPDQPATADWVDKGNYGNGAFDL